MTNWSSDDGADIIFSGENRITLIGLGVMEQWTIHALRSGEPITTRSIEEIILLEGTVN